MQEHLDRHPLPLIGIQRQAPRAHENLDADLVAGHQAHKQGFIEPFPAIKRILQRKSWFDIEHQGDLPKGTRQFEQRNALFGELRDLHREIQRNGGRPRPLTR
jgi:hypothetical protein